MSRKSKKNSHPKLALAPSEPVKKSVDIQIGFAPGEVKVKFSHPVPDLVMTAEAAINLARGIVGASQAAHKARDEKLEQLRKELGGALVDGLLDAPMADDTAKAGEAPS
jgi:hypothetical protein